MNVADCIENRVSGYRHRVTAGIRPTLGAEEDRDLALGALG